MLTNDERPIGAPILPPRRRDRLSVWVAEHPWCVPVIRVAGGLLLVAIVALVVGAELPWDDVVAFVVGALLAGRFGEHEKDRGDILREPPDSLPREFSHHIVQAPPVQSDGRYVRPRHM